MSDDIKEKEQKIKKPCPWGDVNCCYRRYVDITGLLWVVVIDRAGAGGGSRRDRSSEHAGEEKKCSLAVRIERVGAMIVVASCGCEGRGDGPRCCCRHQDIAGNKVSACPSNPKPPNLPTAHGGARKAQGPNGRVKRVHAHAECWKGVVKVYKQVRMRQHTSKQPEETKLTY